MASGPNYTKIDRILGFVGLYAAACVVLLMTVGVVMTLKLTWESW